jgi:hypothetical protein
VSWRPPGVNACSGFGGLMYRVRVTSARVHNGRSSNSWLLGLIARSRSGRLGRFRFLRHSAAICFRCSEWIRPTQRVL